MSGRSLAAAALICVTTAALAEEPAGPYEPFRFRFTGGEVYVRGRAQRDRETFAGGQTRERETYGETGAEVRFAGHVYHPNLLEWDLALRGARTREDIRINDEGFLTNGNLTGFNFTGLLLKAKPVSVRLFASQDESLGDRDFARSTKVSNLRMGAEVYTKGSVPVSLLAETVDQTEAGDIRDVDRHTDHLRLSVTDRRKEDWLTQLTLDFRKTDETDTLRSRDGAVVGTESLPDTSAEAELSNSWRFGPVGKKHSLIGRVRALDRTGFFPNRIFTAEERLELAHTETFKTFYRALFDDNRTEGQHDRTLDGEAGFTQKVYESLDITGRAVAGRHEFIEGQEQRYGGYLEGIYRKKTAIGRYNASLLVGRERQEEQTVGGSRFINDEAAVLTGLTPTALRELNVLPGTITVTDATNIIRYVEGVDYVVSTFGAATRIARLAAGTIADGQAVRVDYIVTAGRMSVFDTDTLNWTNRLTLDKVPLAFYVNYNLRDETLLSGDDPGNLDRQRTLLFGTELERKGFDLILEHEIRDQQLFPPSDTNRARISYNRHLGQSLDLSIGGQAERVQYRQAEQFGLEPGQDKLTTLGAYGNVSWKLSRNAILRLRSDGLKTSGRENRTLLRTGAALEWRLGKLEFSVEARHDIYQQEDTRGSADLLMFYLKRRF